MGYIAELAKQQLERARPTAAAVPAVVEPVEGQLYSDAINPGFSWVVSGVDDEFVWLNMLDRAGAVTESYLQWARNRWATLVERHGLELVPD
jgi:hypothetical protein